MMTLLDVSVANNLFTLVAKYLAISSRFNTEFV